VNAKQILAKKLKKDVPVEHQIEIADREIENAQKQLATYKADIERLTKRISGL